MNDGVHDSNDATVTIDVGAVDDPPEITTPTNADEVSITILEGTVLVTDVDATDVENDTLTFEIVGGAGDHEKFTINPTSGVLSFAAVPDFETPADGNGDNVYDVTVRVSDASGSDTLVVHVTIGDFDEIAPTVTLSAPAETREPFDVVVTFSEPVTGLELNELTVVNGEVTALAGEGTTYTFTVAPTDTGKVTFQLAANVATDAAGNGNLASALSQLDYVDEEATREEAQEVIGQLMTQRNRITMDYKPSIRRRLQRLTGGLDNNGGISAFGLTYKDGRLPLNVVVKEHEVSFAYSLQRSQAVAPAPSLRGKLAVGPFGNVTSRTPAKNELDGEPGGLSESHSRYDQRSNGDESAAMHEVLFGKDDRNAPAKSQDDPRVARNARQSYPALSQLDFESRYAAPQAKVEDRRLDLWVEGTFGEFDIDGSEGTFGVMHVGADYLYTPDIMLGFSTQIDVVESETPDNGTSSEGVGYMVGPYTTIRLTPKLLFDARISWGRSRNTLTSSDMITDEFASARWLVSAALVGKVDITQHFTVLPEARLSWYREDSEAYTNGLDVEIPSSAVETGSFEFGPTLRGTIPYGFDGKFQPFASVKGIWTFANNQYSASNFEHPPHAQTGVRARFDLGFDFTPSAASGRTLSVSGFLDGIGDKDYEVWGATIRLKQRF